MYNSVLDYHYLQYPKPNNKVFLFRNIKLFLCNTVVLARERRRPYISNFVFRIKRKNKENYTRATQARTFHTIILGRLRECKTIKLRSRTFTAGHILQTINIIFQFIFQRFFVSTPAAVCIYAVHTDSIAYTK